MDNNTAKNITDNGFIQSHLVHVPFVVWTKLVSAAVHITVGSRTSNAQPGGFWQASDREGARAFVANFVAMADAKGLIGQEIADIALAIGKEKFAWKRETWAWRS